MPEQQTSGRRTDLLFDARHVRQSGIGTYIRTQLPFLQAAAARHSLSLTVLADPHTVPDLNAGTDVLHASPTGAPMYSLGEQMVWRRAFAARRPRALWSPHYPYPLARTSPKNSQIRLYATVHDTTQLLPFEISGQSTARRFYAKTMLRLTAKACHRIFTPSDATAIALREIVPSARILVTPIPVDEIWFKPVDRTLSSVGAPYLIYVGNVKRYKNLIVLLEAFSALTDVMPHKLVIAGGGASLRTMDERVRSLTEALGDRVVVTGQVDFAVLRSLVASAQLLVMPSLYEGAGLPPLEAMAAGTAVLSSDVPVLRETCGDGADYFDPHDRDSLIQLLRTYCADDAARAALAARGHAHVTQRQQRISPTAAADAICSDLVGP